MGLFDTLEDKIWEADMHGQPWQVQRLGREWKTYQSKASVCVTAARMALSMKPTVTAERVRILTNLHWQLQRSVEQAGPGVIHWIRCWKRLRPNILSLLAFPNGMVLNSILVIWIVYRASRGLIPFELETLFPLLKNQAHILTGVALGPSDDLSLSVHGPRRLSLECVQIQGVLQHDSSDKAQSIQLMSACCWYRHSATFATFYRPFGTFAKTQISHRYRAFVGSFARVSHLLG